MLFFVNQKNQRIAPVYETYLLTVWLICLSSISMYMIPYCSVYVVSYCIVHAQSCPARILEWATILYSREPSRPRDWTSISYVSFIGRWVLYYCATWDTVHDLPDNTKVTSIELGHEKPDHTKEIHILLFLSLFMFSDILCRLLTRTSAN